MDCPNCGKPVPTCAFCGQAFDDERRPWRFPDGPFAGLVVHHETCELDLFFAWVASSDGVTGRLHVD